MFNRVKTKSILSCYNTQADSFKNTKAIKMKIKTIIFNFITFSVFLTQIIHPLFTKKIELQQGLMLQSHSSLPSAAYEGNFEVVKKLIKDGVDPNTADGNGHTALMRGSYRHENIVRFLLDHDADPNQQSNNGGTALMDSKTPNITEVLLKYRADPNLQDKFGNTVLTLASMRGDDKKIEVLLKNKANVDLQDKEGKTALMYAIMFGRDKTVKLLLEHDADFDLQDCEEKTALMHAKHRPIIRKMITDERSRREKR